MEVPQTTDTLKQGKTITPEGKYPTHDFFVQLAFQHEHEFF